MLKFSAVLRYSEKLAEVTFLNICEAKMYTFLSTVLFADIFLCWVIKLVINTVKAQSGGNATANKN